jgi:putative transposase
VRHLATAFRESKDAWCKLLLDLKAQGLQSGPLLAAGDGAMDLWAALAEVFPKTRRQRCWFHKTGNVQRPR